MTFTSIQQRKDFHNSIKKLGLATRKSESGSSRTVTSMTVTVVTNEIVLINVIKCSRPKMNTEFAVLFWYSVFQTFY